MIPENSIKIYSLANPESNILIKYVHNLYASKISCHENELKTTIFILDNESKKNSASEINNVF